MDIAFLKHVSLETQVECLFLFSGLRVHFGIIITLIGIFASWFIFSKTMLGLSTEGYRL